MSNNKYSIRSEEEIPAIVKKWVDDNHEEFGDEYCLNYRKNIFERCKRYLYSPDIYLENKFHFLNNRIKWFLQIYQAIIITGIVGSLIILGKMTIENFIIYIKSVNPKHLLNRQLILWIIPILIIVIIFCFRPKKEGKSWLINYIRRTALMVYNLREIEIEMFYISKILEIREINKDGYERTE